MYFINRIFFSLNALILGVILLLFVELGYFITQINYYHSYSKGDIDFTKQFAWFSFLALLSAFFLLVYINFPKYNLSKRVAKVFFYLNAIPVSLLSIFIFLLVLSNSKSNFAILLPSDLAGVMERLVLVCDVITAIIFYKKVPWV